MSHQAERRGQRGEGRRTIGEEVLHEVAYLALHVVLVLEVRGGGLSELAGFSVVHALRRQRNLCLPATPYIRSISVLCAVFAVRQLEDVPSESVVKKSKGKTASGLASCWCFAFWARMRSIIAMVW